NKISNLKFNDMKNILTIIFVLFTGLQVVAQEENQWYENMVYCFVSQEAQSKEGIQRFYLNFSRRINIKDFSNDNREINAQLEFVVEKDGSFSDIRVINDSQGIGQELMRVLKTMPKWNPGKYDEEIVRSRFILPIKIRININK